MNRDIFGKITPPESLSRFGGPGGNNPAAGIGNLLNLFFQIMIVAGGIYALFNFLLAGYGFLSAGDDPKAIQNAWAKIWQSALGLAVLAGAFVLAAIFGQLLFGDYNAILNPQLPTIEQITTPQNIPENLTQ